MPSRVSRLTNLHIIAFGPFLAFRAGTQWAMSLSLIEILQPLASKMHEKRNTEFLVVSVVGFLDPQRSRARRAVV